MIRRCAIAAAMLLAAGCYDAPYEEPDEGAQPPRHTETIATLRKRYPGKTLLLEGDIIVEGIVTSSDEGRNFYRSFCIEEEGAGIEIMAGIDQLHNDYPVGCRVSLSLKGMALGESRGVLQIGRMPAPESGYATSELLPLRPNPGKLNRYYFASALRSDAFVGYIQEQVAGAKMPRVSMGVFRAFRIPCPPMLLQEQFARFVEQTDKSKIPFETEVAA